MYYTHRWCMYMYCYIYMRRIYELRTQRSSSLGFMNLLVDWVGTLEKPQYKELCGQ